MTLPVDQNALLVGLLALAATSPSTAQDQSRDPEPTLPDWLRIGGQARARYEGIEGQFRASPRIASSDHLAFTRLLLKVEADLGPATFGVELEDSRHWGGGNRSSLTTNEIDPIEFLQLYTDLRFDDDGRSRLRVGRQTIRLGSERLVSRQLFRNTVNSFAGVDYRLEQEDGPTLEAFWVTPTQRLPSDLDALVDNDVELDNDDFDRQFFGALGELPLENRTILELYAYGLLEVGNDTRRRRLITPGVRVLRRPELSRTDFELEGIAQFGESRATPAGPDLDHAAWLVHASVGHTFDTTWKPRIRVAVDMASGDRNPTDGSNQRFDGLFGAQVFDFGPTGIYGTVLRSNIVSPELRIEVRPSDRITAHLTERSIWLQSGSDAVPRGGVQDPSGSAGNYFGEQLEARIRFDVDPGRLRFDVGAAYLFAGDVLRKAPNARGDDVAYVYFQTQIWF